MIPKRTVRHQKKRGSSEPAAVTGRRPGHQVRDREPDKGKVRPPSDELLHIPTLVWLMKEVDTLQAQLIAEAQKADRFDAVSTMDWVRQKIIGHLQREWDRQRQKLSRLNRATAEKILNLERTIARRKAVRLLEDLRQLSKLETTVGTLAGRALRGHAARYWTFLDPASEAPEGGGLIELPPELQAGSRPEAWTAEQIGEMMREHNPEALLAVGHEGAFLGPASRCGQPVLAAYSYSKALAALVEQGLEPEQAEAHLHYILGAWAGPNTPIWILDDKDE